jgi:hypothetical protein
MGLVVLSEDEEPRTLLIHRISKDDIYQRQGVGRSCSRAARVAAALRAADHPADAPARRGHHRDVVGP